MSNSDVNPFNEGTAEPEVIVTAVLAHPLHGRLVEKLIFYVRPNLEFGGQRYKLTWWAAGVAYYQPAAA
jgi:hypothetical protein